MISGIKHLLILRMAVAKLMLPHQPALHKQLHSVVDSSTAHVIGVLLHLAVEAHDIEVSAQLKHLVENSIALRSLAQSLTLQKRRQQIPCRIPRLRLVHSINTSSIRRQHVPQISPYKDKTITQNTQPFPSIFLHPHLQCVFSEFSTPHAKWTEMGEKNSRSLSLRIRLKVF